MLTLGGHLCVIKINSQLTVGLMSEDRKSRRLATKNNKIVEKGLKL